MTWAEMLSEWAVPEHLVAAVPESPYFFDPKVFIAIADEAIGRAADTPSDSEARRALPAEGSVLDVGCGAGAASLRLQPDQVVGVDSSSELLAAFAERAIKLGVESAAVEGRWPEVAAQTSAYDVVVCHHVFYNTPDLASFVTALHRKARSRVVVELTAVHPMAWMAPYWEAMYGVDQPNRPVAEDAVAVVVEQLGVEVRQARFVRTYQMIGENGDEALARIGRRLCLPANRYDELRVVIATTPPPAEREMVTLAWDA
jgi:SAM-dependent methyltransferase